MAAAHSRGSLKGLLSLLSAGFAAIAFALCVLVTGALGPAARAPESIRIRHLVEACRRLRDLSAILPGLERRWHRRPQRHHFAAGLPQGPWHRCHLDFSHVPLAAG